MTKLEICGHEIWEASEDEIRAQWRQTPPEDRHRFWTHTEVDAHMLATPEQLRELVARKKEKPGRLDIAAPPISVASPTRCWCQRHMIACSEGEVCGEDCGGVTFGREEEV